MTKALRFLAALLVALPVFAQAQRIYSQPELDQMLAPWRRWRRAIPV